MLVNFRSPGSTFLVSVQIAFSLVSFIVAALLNSNGAFLHILIALVWTLRFCSAYLVFDRGTREKLSRRIDQPTYRSFNPAHVRSEVPRGK